MNTTLDLPGSAFDFDHHAQAGWDFGDLLGLLGREFFSHHSAHDTTFGSPGEDTHNWVGQTTPFTCAVVSQEMILHMFGVDVSEAQLTYEAASHGWLTDGGTRMEDMARLLELHGVQTHMNPHGSVDALAAELAQGHKVIVGLDSGELWKTDFPWEDFFQRDGADHAVVVTGLDMSDPAHPKVFINDPGDHDGAGKAYPLDQFLDAWADAGNLFVATDHAPADLAHHSVFGANFNSATGMYLDTSFWEGFLKVLARTIVSDKFTHSAGLWDTAQEAMASPWESMTGTERNELFREL